MSKKITDLTSYTTPDAATDVIEIVDVANNQSKKITRNNLLGITGNPVGHTDTQTLSNKTINNSNIIRVQDINFFIQDDGDTTKQVKFQLSSITTATTRTLTIPDTDDVLVTESYAQGLRNKTIYSPTINTPTIVNPTLQTDTVSEYTSANGVTVDGLNIKDSKLNTNNSVVTNNITDDAVTAAKIDWASTGVNAGIWNEELGRTTNSAQTSISVSFSAREFIEIRFWYNNSTTMQIQLTFNNDSGANYSWRNESSGAADTTGTSTNFIELSPSSNAVNHYGLLQLHNTTSDEKTCNWSLSRNIVGAATAPGKIVGVGKWANTANQATSVKITASTGNLGTATLIALGHN